jgi:hypothetical protein
VAAPGFRARRPKIHADIFLTMRIVVMQPTFLPWMGYFDLIDSADSFVFLDDVQYSHQSWQQRNRIVVQERLHWLTLPVHKKSDSLIAEVELENPAIMTRFLRTIEMNYKRAICFEQFFPVLSQTVGGGTSWSRLCDLNIALIRCLMSCFGIHTPVIRSSDMRTRAGRVERLVSICCALNATSYLSPMGSAEYLVREKDQFAEACIELLFHHYVHPVYRQIAPQFLPYASAVDLLLNEGSASLEIIRSGRRTPITRTEQEHRMRDGATSHE